MGQPIEVSTMRLGDVTIFITDRTLGGQDGEAFGSREEAAGGTWPARLAARLWDADPEIAGVYVFSNTISVERPSGWTEGQVEVASVVIRDLFVFYEENRTEAN